MVDINKVAQKNLDVFESSCNKISCLVYSRTDGDKKLLNQILDHLNGLDYNSFCIKQEKGALLINQCCYLIPSEETSLVSKAINVFINLLIRAHIIIKGKTLSLAIGWCLKSMKHGNQINILKCLQALVKGNNKKTDEDCQNILKEVEKLSNNFSFNAGSEEISLSYLKCVEAITFPGDIEEAVPLENVTVYYKIFREVLFKEKTNFIGNEIIFCKYLITAMRGIENLIQISEEIINTDLGSILGIVKGYMLYGLLGHDSYKIQKLFPSATTIPEVLKSSQSVKKLRGKYDRRPKKVVVPSIKAIEEVDDVRFTTKYVGYSENTYQTDLLLFGCKTSDSDFSDSELTQNTKIKSSEGKVRHCALILLATILQKIDPKVFIAFMTSFLPDGAEFAHMRTLITCLLKDPLPKCRSEVLGILLTIISSSRQYFLQADSLSKSSFTAFSCTISNIIKELHRCLIITLNSENNSTVIKRALKCISDLIRCTPYHKMEAGLITNIAAEVKLFMKNKDVSIQIFALTVFGCIVSVEPKIQEVKDIINPFHRDAHLKNKNVTCSNSSVEEFEFIDECEFDEVKEKSWLLEQCLHNLTDKNKNCDSSTNAALQIESLQVVGALVRNFFMETLVSFPNDMIHLLEHCSNKSEYSIRLFSGKLMDTVFNSLQFSFCQEDESKRPSLPLVTMLWDTLLPGPVTALIQSQEEPMLRCTGCDCIANVGVQVQNGQTSSQSSLIFDQLSRNKQIMCITLLFGCLQDESPAVRSSAARAMAIFILFPSLREDSLFFLDVVDATLAAAKDQHSIVRTQVSWLLGNLSEAVVLNKQKNVDDGLSTEVLVELLRAGIRLSRDNPKIKPGAVRGIGNFLQIVDEEFMKKHKDSVVEGIDALLKNATMGTFMKARWNSCYAISNTLQNPLIRSCDEWVAKIFNVMISLVQHYKNFKVRISAGFVLAVPPDRECYGDLYNCVWSAVLNGLENSKNISDFNEYQHRDQLVDQLCLVICHLVSVMGPSDLNPLQDVLYFHLDNLNHFMNKFQERLVPEKSGVLLNATDKINVLMYEKCLTAEEKNVLRVLGSVFINQK